MRLSSRMLKLLVVALVVAPASSDAVADEIQQDFVASGVTRKVGGYRPERAEMDEDESIVKTAPEELENPKYGLIEIGEASWAFILDEPEEGDAKLYVDTNGDGDLTNDPETSWEGETRGELTMYSGEGKIDLGGGRLGAINFYRFDPTDERRAALKNTLMFYADYGFEFSFNLDGKEFSTFVAGMPVESTRLSIDRDGNGKMSRRFEMAAIGEPFNFTGTTYVFDLKDGNLTLGKSDKEVEQLPLPPDLEIGKKAPTFAATTMDGTEVDFPKSFAGKIVMLDFWATWCGPCIGEIPNMKEAYADWHEDGFEILGVSFDRAEMEEKINEFLEEREMPWPQIYEGKMWDTSLGNMHDVSGIPFVLLVDGDSGEILATARQLRGPGLSEFVGKQLKEKFGDAIDLNKKEEKEDPEGGKEEDDKEEDKDESK